MQAVKQILQEALQRCIDEHGVVISEIKVTHQREFFYGMDVGGKDGFPICQIDIFAQVIDAKGGER